MSLHNEIEFENDICAHLAAHGWLYSEDDAGYDRALALFPDDALAWLQQSQPEGWAKFASFHGAAAETDLLSRLAKVLANEGTLKVLRGGFKAAGAGSHAFDMAQFKPAFGFNAEVAARYSAGRLRVMRQVHYSVSGENSIDLVLFVNGIPVATIELKTDFTQAVEDAKLQYRQDRLSKDPGTHREAPLLTFKRGALVHFAVSTEEVWQLAAVTRLVEAAGSEGVGRTYLFQHSAGSGKSNTIGWCAHRLSTLHDEHDTRAFDSALAVTDRTVPDAQLKETVSQFEATPGVVVSIDSDRGSKSGQLARALKRGAMIIVVTIQTFPFVMEEMRRSKGLSGKRFAVIIDEAHSSQSGSTVRHLRGVLASEVRGDEEEESI